MAHDDKGLLEEQARRGDQADKLMQHPLLVEAFSLIEQDIQHKWQNSPARDAEGREGLWTQLKLLHRLRLEIQAVAENGKIARQTLLQRLGLTR